MHVSTAGIPQAKAVPEGAMTAKRNKVDQSASHSRTLSHHMQLKNGNLAGRQSKNQGVMGKAAVEYLQDNSSLLYEFDQLQDKVGKAFGDPLFALNPLEITCPVADGQGCTGDGKHTTTLSVLIIAYC